MLKFTILTVMMILGMSTVSFGKTYLFIPKRGTLLTPDENYLTKQSRLNKIKYLVITDGNNRKMISGIPFILNWLILEGNECTSIGGWAMH